MKKLENELGINKQILQEQKQSKKSPLSTNLDLFILRFQCDKLFNILEKFNQLDSFLQLNSTITIEQKESINKIKSGQEKIAKQREILKNNYCLIELNRINKLKQEFENNFEKDFPDRFDGFGGVGV